MESVLNIVLSYFLIKGGFYLIFLVVVILGFVLAFIVRIFNDVIGPVAPDPEVVYGKYRKCTGVAYTDLIPEGIVEINNNHVKAIAEAAHIKKGEKIECFATGTNCILVRPVAGQEEQTNVVINNEVKNFFAPFVFLGLIMLVTLFVASIMNKWGDVVVISVVGTVSQ